MLKEAKRLYDLGFAVHWIKPGSKAPVKSAWSQPTRDSWPVVEREYKKGYGLGVRLGESSQFKDGTYLANIDVDLKGGTARDKREALAVVEEHFPGVVDTAPCVSSPHGLRYFVRLRKPVASGKLSSSPRTIKVLLPTAAVNRLQHQAVKDGIMTASELAAGYRVRNAWEVELMSLGKQVVLPPSVHPDTRQLYAWQPWPIASFKEIPRVMVKADVARGRGRPAGTTVVQGWTPSDKLDLGKLSAKWRAALETGDGVQDRSAACMSVAMAMLKSGYSEGDILTALTDPAYYLGETAYDHRQTKSRKAAAAWIRDYCLAKARDEVDAARAFSVDVGVTPTLTKVEAKKQAEEVTEQDWTFKLERNNGGSVKPSLRNVLLVLDNEAGIDLIKYDSFADREFYGRKPPWLGKKNAAITDVDAVHIKVWLAEEWGFEPSTNTVFDAISSIGQRNAFNPVKTELEALPPWDGVERVDTWLADHFGAKGDAEYLAQVFRKWLLGSITRTYSPGHKFDWMPIFQGKQGTGKSSFGAILFGADYFADWLPDLSDKDAALGLQGIRCVEFGELASLRKNELDNVKAFITRQVDKVRPPYGRKKVEVFRCVVFFGTTNREHYLVDDTGNRRFCPIVVHGLDFEALRRDRDQLWAEALALYHSGMETSLYLSGAADIFAHATREEKRVIDEPSLMRDAIYGWLEDQEKKPEAERFNLDKFKLVDLFQEMGPLNKWKDDAKHVQWAARALRTIIFGFSRISFTPRRIKGMAWWGKRYSLDTPK